MTTSPVPASRRAFKSILARALDLDRQGRHHEALEVLRGIEPRRSTDRALQIIVMASLLDQMRRFSEAVELLRPVLGDRRWGPEAGCRLAAIMFAQERLDEAEKLARQQLRSTQHKQASFILGRIALARRDLPAASRAFTVSATEGAGHFRGLALRGLAVIEAASGRPDEAWRLHREAERLESSPSLAVRWYGESIELEGAFAVEALEHADRILTELAGRGDLPGVGWSWWAHVAQASGDIHAATERLRHAEELGGVSEASLAAVRALILSDVGRVAEAEIQAEIAVNGDPPRLFPQAYVRCHHRLAGALDSLRRLVDHDPGEPETLRLLELRAEEGMTWRELLERESSEPLA